ncbi:hypothetical protein ACOSQ3_002391 [Xanthoceras sorbifolium]
MNSLGCIAAGRVIRDSKGQWLGGFTVKKGRGNALEAEVWAIVEGLLYAWQARYKFLIVETDCKSVVELIVQDIRECHPLFNLLHKCKRMIDGDWVCKLVHICREANNLADYLAKMGQFSELNVKHLEDPPTECLEVIKDDVSGWLAGF